MTALEILLPIGLGGVIGYVTNDIAIKMLFSPKTEKHIGKWKVPFTPGLIPKEKARIAKSIGDVIASELLDSKTLSDVLASPEMLAKIRKSIEAFLDKNLENEDTLFATLKKYVSEETLYDTYETLRDDVSRYAYRTIENSTFAEKIASNMLYWVRDAIFFIRIPILDRLGGDKLAEKIIEPIAEKIGIEVNLAVLEHSKEVIEKTIDEEANKIFNKKICDLLYEYEYKIDDLIDFIMETYVKVINENLPKIINELDIAKIVEDKINAFDIAEFEAILMRLMKKELRAIVWLGAVLGAAMGVINIIIPMWL